MAADEYERLLLENSLRLFSDARLLFEKERYPSEAVSKRCEGLDGRDEV